MPRPFRAVPVLALVLVFLVTGVVVPDSPSSPTAAATQPPETIHELPRITPRTIPLSPREHWPGLAVVDFRGACSNMYVLRLARPIDGPVDPETLLASLRQDRIPEGLDATLDFYGYLRPFASSPAILSPMTQEQSATLHAVLRGGHFDNLRHGEGAVLAGTFWPRGTPVLWDRWYLVESTAAILASESDLGWTPLEVRFALNQITCD